MNILYISCLCSKRKFDQILNNSKEKPGQQVQKYHRLIVEGFLAHENVNVTCLTGLPASRQITKQWFFFTEEEAAGKVKYRYAPFINFPLLRQLSLFIYCFIYVLWWGQKNRNGAIICDILNVSISSAALFASKLTKVKNIGIVTDIPGYLVNNDKKVLVSSHKLAKKLIINLNKFIMHGFGYYVFLTKQMNALVNNKNHPFIVIEGQVDINMSSVDNIIENKHSKRICLYAGALNRLYGVHTMVEGFLKAHVPNAELHVYGSGSYGDELIKICKTHNSVKYFGVVPNEAVVKEQLRASLLINPRPSTEEYTKYSFPSKNMEYFVSGTPVLTTNLPGMPQEYKDYAFIISDETVDGIAKELGEVLSMKLEKLHLFGLQAKEFVLREKNNVIQAKKILDLLKERG